MIPIAFLSSLCCFFAKDMGQKMQLRSFIRYEMIQIKRLLSRLGDRTKEDNKIWDKQIPLEYNLGMVPFYKLRG